MQVKTKALLAIFIAAVLWASAGTVAKILVARTDPFIVAFYRFGIASVILLPFFLKEKKPKGFFRALLPLGLFNSLNVLFYYTGAARTTANTIIILGTAVPIVTTVLSYILIHETVSKQKALGISLGLVGALFIVLLPILVQGQALGGTLTGNLLEVGSLLSWSSYIVYSRFILSKGKYSPVLSTSMNFFACAVSSALAALITRQSFYVPPFATPSYLGTMLFAAIILTVVTYFLFQWGVQHVSASTASLKEYVQLVIGIGINAAILGEHFTLAYFIGSLFIVVGVLIATGQHVSRKLAGLLFAQEN